MCVPLLSIADSHHRLTPLNLPWTPTPPLAPILFPLNPPSPRAPLLPHPLHPHTHTHTPAAV